MNTDNTDKHRFTVSVSIHPICVHLCSLHSNSAILSASRTPERYAPRIAAEHSAGANYNEYSTPIILRYNLLVPGV